MDLIKMSYLECILANMELLGLANSYQYLQRLEYFASQKLRSLKNTISLAYFSLSKIANTIYSIDFSESSFSTNSIAYLFMLAETLKRVKI